MKKPTVKNVRILLISAIAFVLLLYLPNSLAGYITFCDKILGDELDCYDSSNIPMLIARIALPFTISVTYPLYSHTLRMSISKVLFGTPYPDTLFRYLITIIFLGISLIVAIFFKQIDVVAGITGALGGSMLVLIVPGILYYKVSKEHRTKFYYLKVAISVFYVVLGLTIFVIGTYVTVADSI